MEWDVETGTPIYRQLARWLEGEILADRLKVEERVYSQYQLADMFQVNPATAAKGLNLLAAENIIYKKRGLGMFVAAEAKEIIFAKRKENNLKKLIAELAREARSLGVTYQQLAALLNAEMGGGENECGNLS